MVLVISVRSYFLGLDQTTPRPSPIAPPPPNAPSLQELHQQPQLPGEPCRPTPAWKHGALLPNAFVTARTTVGVHHLWNDYTSCNALGDLGPNQV